MLLYLLLLLLLDDELLLEEALPERFLGSYWGRGMAGWLEWNPPPDPDHLTCITALVSDSGGKELLA